MNWSYRPLLMSHFPAAGSLQHKVYMYPVRAFNVRPDPEGLKLFGFALSRRDAL